MSQIMISNRTKQAECASILGLFIFQKLQMVLMI